MSREEKKVKEAIRQRYKEEKDVGVQCIRG